MKYSKTQSTLPELNQTELDALNDNRMQDARASLRGRYPSATDAQISLALAIAPRAIPAPASAAIHP